MKDSKIPLLLLGEFWAFTWSTQAGLEYKYSGDNTINIQIACTPPEVSHAVSSWPSAGKEILEARNKVGKTEIHHAETVFCLIIFEFEIK